MKNRKYFVLVVIAIIFCFYWLWNIWPSVDFNFQSNLQSGYWDRELVNPKIQESITSGIAKKRVFIDGAHAIIPTNFYIFKSLELDPFISSDTFIKNKNKLFSSGLLIMNYAIGKPELSKEEYKIVRQYIVNGGRVLLLCPAWVWTAYDKKDIKRLPYYNIAKYFGLTMTTDYVAAPFKIVDPFFSSSDPILAKIKGSVFSATTGEAANIIIGSDGKVAMVGAKRDNAKIIVFGHSCFFDLADNPKSNEFIGKVFEWLFASTIKL